MGEEAHIESLSACPSSGARRGAPPEQGEFGSSLKDLAGVELDSLANALAIAQLKGLLSVRLLLGGLALCALAVLGVVIALTLAIVALVVVATSAGIPLELAFLGAALLCLLVGWICRRAAAARFSRLAKLVVSIAGPDAESAESGI
ncbi:hypothetical protein NCG89_06615 [Spongiibacter taiwanensis]|uniref:hypothetical protein n=1 Tax=Spongiibacter taiwanensis TaxID=1748242 RepID=UPI002036042F|nr:hypothetical protein [Spongiibacter taiwanensis]USA44441.1 hypothetical protein NCG89_06615 [Spongiibacter taiwanensis]